MAVRKKIEENSVETEETTLKPVADVILYPAKTEVVFLNDELEITYSRSWELAVVQYEKESIFHSFKVRVPTDSDLDKVGEKLCDMMTELQEADLMWARSMTNNTGSLVTKIIPKLPDDN